VGRIVIETDPETGKDHVELTLDNGQVMIFHGNGDSELAYHRAEVEQVDVSTSERTEYIPGRTIPAHWTFHINIRDIPGVIVNEPEEPDGERRDLEK
jgi:hypothetical protein